MSRTRTTGRVTDTGTGGQLCLPGAVVGAALFLMAPLHLYMTLLVYRYIPFSGGPRKCVGDQFALMEAVVALAVTLKRFNFSLVPGQQINMTTGATIHTTDGLYMTMQERSSSAGSSSKQQPAAAVA